MRIRMYVKSGQNEWTEEHNTETSRHEFQGTPEEIAKQVVDYFNSTLQKGEMPRELIKAEVIPDDEPSEDEDYWIDDDYEDDDDDYDWL